MVELTQLGAVRDPVCGMQIAPTSAAGSVEHDGKTYSFCSRACVEKFRSNPSLYMPTKVDPVCGMKVAPARAAATVEQDGTAYYFCGKSCAAKFTANPGAYLNPSLATDPVCHMQVNPAKAKATSTHDGIAYYFCCQGCHDKFVLDPKKYLQPSTPSLVMPNIAPKQPTTPVQAAGTRVLGPGLRNTFARWIPRYTESSRAHVQSVAWRSSRRRSRYPARAPSTPAPCIRRLCARSQGVARSAAWPWNRAQSVRKKRIPSWTICGGVSGLA